jgi:hypothetical protein
MTYGYKWIEAEQRYMEGSQCDDDLFVPQVREMQPRGHWVRSGEREFRRRGMYTWEPSLWERLKRRLDGWRWHKYDIRARPLPNLDAEATL